MATVKIEPTKVQTLTKNLSKYQKDYEENYKKLVSVIEKNDARLDTATQNALLTSCNNMKAKFADMSQFLTKAIEVSNDVAKEFKKVNDNSAAKINNIKI